MLNLTRFPTESIQIGDDITVTVLAVNGNQVRLGIVAPKDVIVLREEVIARMGRKGLRNRASQARQHRGGQPVAGPDEPAPAQASATASPKEPKVRYKRRARVSLQGKV